VENIHECVLESSLKCSSEHPTETQLAIAQKTRERERERDVCHLRVLVLFRSEETQNCFQRYNDGGVRDRKYVSDIMADV